MLCETEIEILYFKARGNPDEVFLFFSVGFFVSSKVGGIKGTVKKSNAVFFKV